MIELTIQPRVQREKWSLYWRESMATKTEVLDAITLKNIDEKTTKVSSVLETIAKQIGWQPRSELLRLEGFEEPWERCIFGGRECRDEDTLQDCGIVKSSTLTTVRKVLVAEGWKIRTGDDDDSETDEEDF
mmetsp:Transcript_7766/g.19873  ORF Transcript_7766/g.19873 Transcript_7766/m.19873 type:complete len:131 (-) Transcript_7766:1606-1998(-)